MKIIVSFFLISVALILVYTVFSSNPETHTYYEQIKKHREEVDRFIREDFQSPFTNSENTEIRGLSYFEVNKDYKVKASVRPITDPGELTLPMSDGTKKNYYRIARVQFSLNGSVQELVLLKAEDLLDNDQVFLPFYDETSANETYGGGRYLDIVYNNEPTIMLDFNLAYNPYCAYSDNYRCPLPPRENRITVPVYAGERSYEKSD